MGLSRVCLGPIVDVNSARDGHIENSEDKQSKVYQIYDVIGFCFYDFELDSVVETDLLGLHQYNLENGCLFLPEYNAIGIDKTYPNEITCFNKDSKSAGTLHKYSIYYLKDMPTSKLFMPVFDEHLNSLFYYKSDTIIDKDIIIFSSTGNISFIYNLVTKKFEECFNFNGGICNPELNSYDIYHIRKHAYYPLYRRLLQPRKADTNMLLGNNITSIGNSAFYKGPSGNVIVPGKFENVYIEYNGGYVNLCFCENIKYIRIYNRIRGSYNKITINLPRNLDKSIFCGFMHKSVSVPLYSNCHSWGYYTDIEHIADTRYYKTEDLYNYYIQNMEELKRLMDEILGIKFEVYFY